LLHRRASTDASKDTMIIAKSLRGGNIGRKEISMTIAESFGRTGFASFINSSAGRLVRILAGLALIGWGYTQRDSTAGIVLMVLGLVPLAAGVFNLCVISALLGGPIRGAQAGSSKS
jgi:hypothetical protein